MPAGNYIRKTRTPGVLVKGSKKDPRYYIDYRCHGTCDGCKSGQHRERAYGSHDDAVKLLKERRHEVEQKRARVQRGEALPVTRTFAEVRDEYLASRAFDRLAPGTQKKYREAFKIRTARFDSKPIASITTADVAQWLSDLRTMKRVRARGGRTHGLGESAINAALTALRVVFRFACQHRPPYITTNPVGGLNGDELPGTEDRRPVQVLDEDELEQAFAALPDPLVLQVKAWTGLRSSELRALVPSEDIDLDRKRITVSRQLNERGERVRLKDRALTESRTVPLTDRAVEALRDRLALREERGIGGGEFLFGAPGAPPTHGQLDAAFRMAVAGIERKPGHRLSPHSLRHGYGSLLLAHGVKLQAVSAWLGHRHVSTTEKWYVQQVESMLDLEAERMRQAVNETVNETPSPGLPTVPDFVPQSA
jgi:integrase